MSVRAAQGRDAPFFRVQLPFSWHKTGPGTDPQKFVYLNTVLCRILCA